MTAITYSSATQRPLEEMQVLEHPSSSRNVLEPISKILQLWNIWEHSENPILKSYGLNGQKWCKEKEVLENDGGTKGGKLHRKRQTWGTIVSKERMKRGGDDQLSNKQVGKELKGSSGKWVERKDKSETDVSGILSAAKREDEIKQSEKWMKKHKSGFALLGKFHLKNRTEEEVKKEKNIMKKMRNRHIFLWLLLFLSLCPTPASSQVIRSHSYFRSKVCGIVTSGFLNFSQQMFDFS